MNVRAQGSTLTITPGSLAPRTRYALTVSAGAVLDAQGNAWAGLGWRESPRHPGGPREKGGRGLAAF